MPPTETERSELVGDAVTSFTLLMPAELRGEIERAARTHERSTGAEIRVAVRRWLDETQGRDRTAWR